MRGVGRANRVSRCSVLSHALRLTAACRAQVHPVFEILHADGRHQGISAARTGVDLVYVSVDRRAR